MTDKPKRTLVALASDTHCGSSVGLMPPEWVTEDGNTVRQNQLQRVAWDQWRENWATVSALRKKKDRLIIVHAGDAVEGKHHDNEQLITTRKEEQERIHVACMEQALQDVGYKQDADELWYVAGTTAHVGSGATSEERIVRELCEVPADAGERQVVYHLRRRVNGVLIDVAHQGPRPGVRAWTRNNTLALTLRSIYLSCLETNQPVPRYWVRAHRHKFVTADVRRNGGGVAIEGFLLPANTLKGEYANTVAVDELADLGMLVIGIEPDGLTWHRPLLMQVQQDGIYDDDAIADASANAA